MLQIFESREQERDLMENSIKGLASPGVCLKILEAGCGRNWPIKLQGVQYSLTGVDFDRQAIEIRQQKVKDLDHAIVGDLRHDHFGSEQFDVIYSSFVLEHIQGAEQVMSNFKRWLRPGGLLILRIPDRDTVFGFLTRLTPFWFHVFYRKYILGFENSGQPGFPPYPTYYDQIVSRQGIHQFCQQNGFQINEEYGAAFYLDTPGRFSGLVRFVVSLVSLLSLRRLPGNYNVLTYVLEKCEREPD
jgi:2-polyprenyl-3-methyl-5-hydroxy-6-metoxy-1,4-benzoquinol methylase